MNENAGEYLLHLNNCVYLFIYLPKSNVQHSQQISHCSRQDLQVDVPHLCLPLRYDTRCYFNVRSKADMSQLSLPHGTDNYNNNDRLTAFDPGQPG